MDIAGTDNDDDDDNEDVVVVVADVEENKRFCLSRFATPPFHFNRLCDDDVAAAVARDDNDDSHGKWRLGGPLTIWRWVI